MSIEIFDKKSDTQQLIFPGTRLCVIEEFYPGPGTMVDGQYVYAAITGYAVIDKEKYEISIQPKSKQAVQPKIGSICLGSVVSISKQMATIALYYVDDEEVYPSYTCLLHVSETSRSYLESTEDAVNIGDIVRVKIIDAKTIPVQCTMVDSKLGVVISYCSKCGEKMKKIGINKLKCTSCNNIESKKTAVDYGKLNINFHF